MVEGEALRLPSAVAGCSAPTFRAGVLGTLGTGFLAAGPPQCRGQVQHKAENGTRVGLPRA